MSENKEKLKIYISHSSKYDYINKIYEPIKKSNLMKLNSFFFPEEDKNKIVSTKNIIVDSDLLIADVSLPSTGQGIEMGWANFAEIPIICIYEKGSKPSSSVKFVADLLIEYENAEDMVNKISNYIKNIS